MENPAETTIPPTVEAVRAAARAAGARRLGAGPVLVRAEVGSTQDLVFEQAAASAPEGALALAERQTGGRGRRGRPWVSPSGVGLWVSILLRPSAERLAAVPVALLAGLAVARAVDETTGLRAGLRWPNDVLIGEKKVCGILGEAREDPAEGDARVVALGIGLNANLRPGDLPADLAGTATSLAIETGRAVDRLALLGRILAGLEGLLDRAERAEERPAVIAEVSERLLTLGRTVRVRFEGGRSFTGEALRLSATGGLVVREEDGGEREVLAGDLEHLAHGEAS